MSGYAKSFALTFLLLAICATALVTSGNAQQGAEDRRPDRTAFTPPTIDAKDQDDAENAVPGIEAPSLASWSKIVFQSFRDGNWNIYMSDGAGFGQTRLTSNDRAELHPHLNRGATHVVYAQQAGDFEIYKMNVDGSNPLPLTSNGADDGRPMWSPDGTKIAFESYRDGQAEIYVMNADGGNQTRLTAHGDYDGMPAWSPDGAQIAFVSRRTGGYRIWIMNADGSGKRQLSRQPYSFHPTWSPDGAQIAFDADGDGDGWQELWRMNVDGSAAEQVVNPAATWDAWAGSWSPDGRYIIFTRIGFIYYEGNLYWTSAYLDVWDSHTGNDNHLTLNSREWEPRWQTMDNQAPESRVHGLLERTTTRYPYVSWVGQDAGTSGLSAYDVQYRVGSEGAWQDWLLGTTETFAHFPATPGTTIYFRSRARDNAYNWESWPAAADTDTAFYEWPFSGTVTDNRGVPAQDKGVTVHPETLQPVRTDDKGVFHGYTVAGGEHNLSITSPHYGALEETPFQPVSAAQQNFYLPPSDNLVENGSFEEGSEQPSGWAVEGNVSVEVVQDPSASGRQALAIGSACTDLHLCVDDVVGDLPFLLNPVMTMAGDKDGNLHTLSLLNLGEYARIFHNVRSSSDNGKWSSKPTIVDEIPPAGDYLRLHMAFDSQETLHAVWLGPEGLKHVYKTKGAAWTTPDVIADVEYGDQYYVADFAIDAQDGFHVLYIGSERPWLENLLYLERLPTGRWRAPREIWREKVTAPHIAVGPDGSLHVAWQVTYSNDPAGDHLLFYRVRSPEGVWQPREVLFNAYNHFSTELLDLGFDLHGILHLFWHDGDEDTIRHATKGPDEPWAAPGNLGPLGRSMVWDVDSLGTIHWVADGHYRQYTHENGWTEPVSPGDVGSVLYLEIDPKDFLHLAWTAPSLGYVSNPITPTLTNGSATIAQQTTIPADMAAPTLSFMARARQDLANDGTGVQLLVTDGLTSTAVFSQTLLNEWRQYWVDLEAWRGETITVSFRLDQRFDDPSMELFLDDVTLGSAHPDTWLGVSGPAAAKPGDAVAYQIDYGNRGAVDVYTGTLTVALPPELVFQTASRPPTSLSPLTWDLGALPAQSVGEPFVLTATVANTATPLLTISSHFTVEGIPSEIESANNARALPLLIGERRLLPAVSRP